MTLHNIVISRIVNEAENVGFYKLLNCQKSLSQVYKCHQTQYYASLK